MLQVQNACWLPNMCPLIVLNPWNECLTWRWTTWIVNQDVSLKFALLTKFRLKDTQVLSQLWRFWGCCCIGGNYCTFLWQIAMHLYLCTGCKGEWRPTLIGGHITVTQGVTYRMIFHHWIFSCLLNLCLSINTIWSIAHYHKNFSSSFFFRIFLLKQISLLFPSQNECEKDKHEKHHTHNWRIVCCLQVTVNGLIYI